MPVSAVCARGRIFCKVVGFVESAAVPLKTLSESVDVVGVPKAGDEVRLGALQEADLVWKEGGDRRKTITDDIVMGFGREGQVGKMCLTYTRSDRKFNYLLKLIEQRIFTN